MEIAFETTKNFIVPDGIYSATLDEVREQRKNTKQGIVTFVRFVWRIDSLATETTTSMAGTNYVPTLREDGQLRLMLESWLSPEFVQEQQQKGNWQLKTLEGKQADLIIKNIKNKGYKKPYSSVEQVLPHGTKTRTAAKNELEASDQSEGLHSQDANSLATAV